MKLHFTYNLSDLAQAIKIAEQTAEFADILGIGSLLLFKEGVNAIKTFKLHFPNKELFAEARITEKGEAAVNILAQAGADYISLLAGAPHKTIHKAVAAAKRFGVKIALDMLDTTSLGQSAMDAKTLGLNLLIVHRTLTAEESIDISSEWHNVKDNTDLPIFITGKIDEETFRHVIELKPHGVMIGSAITKSDNPAKAAQFFRSQI